MELVDHVELLRTAAGPERAVQRLEHRWEEQEETLVRINHAAAFASFVATLASVLPIAGMATYLVIAGVNHVALVLALLVLIGRAAAPLGELATAGLHINDLFAALRNFNQITHPPELPEPLHLKFLLVIIFRYKTLAMRQQLKICLSTSHGEQSMGYRTKR